MSARDDDVRSPTDPAADEAGAESEQDGSRVDSSSVATGADLPPGVPETPSAADGPGAEPPPESNGTGVRSLSSLALAYRVVCPSDPDPEGGVPEPDSDPPPSRWVLGTLVVFASAALAAGLGRGIVTTYLPVLLDQIRSAPGLIGTALLVNAAAGFFVPLVVGRWSDARSGPRGRRMPFIVGGTVLTAAGLGAIALGSSSYFLLLTALGAVVYIGLNAITTAHRALIPDCFSHAERARATSAQELALLGGALVGVVAGGALTAVTPWAPFAFAAAVTPLLAAPTVLGVREHLRRMPEQVAEPIASEEPGRFATSVRYYAQSAMRPGVRALLGAQILWVLGYAAMPSFFVLYAESVLELEPAGASVFLAGFGIVTALAIVAAGRVRDPGRQKPLLGLGVAAMGIGLGAVALASTPLTVAPGLLLAALGFGFISTLGFPLFTALIPEDEEGGYTALFFSVRSIASAVALPVAGFSIAITGSFRALFVLGAAATLIALLPLATVPSAGKPGLLERAWRRLASTEYPPWRWWVRGAGIVAAVFVGVMALGLIVDATFLQSLDEWGFRRINSLGPGGDAIWDAFNPHTRNYEITVLIALSVAALTRPRLIVPVFLLLAVAFLLSAGLLEAAQAIWDRPRPEEAMDPATLNLHGVWASFESYPSGHMIITTALAAGTALAFPRLRPLAWAYIAIIGVTRIVFGAHFPLDVLMGILFGYVTARVGFALVARLWPVPEWRERLEGGGSERSGDAEPRAGFERRADPGAGPRGGSPRPAG